MMDEHFMREWSESHDAFSAGITRMTSKFGKRDGCDEPVGGAELRYAHANRIFIAIVAGLFAATAAVTIATSDGRAAQAATVRPATQY